MNGEYVRNKLKESDFQMKEIASKLAISQQSLYNRLQSKDIKVSFLFALAKAVNKNVYYFFGDEYSNIREGKIRPFNDDDGNSKSAKNVVTKNDHNNDHIFDTKPKVQNEVVMEFEKSYAITDENSNKKDDDITVVKENGDLEYSSNKKFSKKMRDSGKLVPYYDIDFAAGDGITIYDDNSINPTYYMDVPEFSGCTAFRAYSDSMEKLIKSGSILFGTKINSWLEHLEYGQIYGVICNDGRRYLKYIRKADKFKSYFLLRSENEDYDDFDMPKKSIRSIWLIHGWLNKRT